MIFSKRHFLFFIYSGEIYESFSIMNSIFLNLFTYFSFFQIIICTYLRLTIFFFIKYYFYFILDAKSAKISSNEIRNCKLHQNFQDKPFCAVCEPGKSLSYDQTKCIGKLFFN